MADPDNLVLALLREMRADMTAMRGEMATKADLAEARAELRSEIHFLRADVASDIQRLDRRIEITRKELSEQVAGLRRAVREYHSSAIGHGVLISELDERLRRVERHLDLPDAR